jgi:hypothetical protein
MDYFVADENCKEALKELMIEENKIKWLSKYEKLFKKVSISPLGLPNIANANFNGVNYHFIGEFHHEYQLVQHELTT